MTVRPGLAPVLGMFVLSVPEVCFTFGFMLVLMLLFAYRLSHCLNIHMISDMVPTCVL